VVHHLPIDAGIDDGDEIDVGVRIHRARDPRARCSDAHDARIGRDDGDGVLYEAPVRSGYSLVHPGTLIKFRANSLAACRSPAPGRGSCRNLRAKSSTPFVFSPSEVWAAGGRGNITRWDGTKLTLLPTGTNQYVTGIWGASPNEVWIAGTGGMVRHYDG